MGHNTRENTKILLNGAWVGGTMTVPGVSGGTMAMVLGIYDRLISSVSRVFKEPKQSIPFYCGLHWEGRGYPALFQRHQPAFILPVGGSCPLFFLGAVGGGIPLIFKEAGIKKIWLRGRCFCGNRYLKRSADRPDPGRPVHAGSRRGIRYSHTGFRRSYHRSGPGPSRISASQMLYMLGIYESTLKAVGNMDIAALVPLAAGGLLGTFFLQKCWKGCWKTYPAHLSSYSWLYVCFSAGAVSGNSGRSRGSVQPGGCGSGIYADLWDWENELAIAIPHFL